MFGLLLAGLLLLVSGCASEEDTSVDSELLQWERLAVPLVERQVLGFVPAEDAIPEQERAFKSADDWRSFWAGLRAPGVPDLDFATRRAAVVSLGRKAPGWAVTVTRVTYDAESQRTVVYVQEQRPNPQKVYGSVAIYPAAAVSFTAKPGPVEFVRETTTDPI